MSGLDNVLKLECLIPAHVTSRACTGGLGICILPAVSCRAPWSLGLLHFPLCPIPIFDPCVIPAPPLSTLLSPILCA